MPKGGNGQGGGKQPKPSKKKKKKTPPRQRSRSRSQGLGGTPAGRGNSSAPSRGRGNSGSSSAAASPPPRTAAPPKKAWGGGGIPASIYRPTGGGQSTAPPTNPPPTALAQPQPAQRGVWGRVGSGVPASIATKAEPSSPPQMQPQAQPQAAPNQAALARRRLRDRVAFEAGDLVYGRREGITAFVRQYQQEEGGGDGNDDYLRGLRTTQPVPAKVNPLTNTWRQEARRRTNNLSRTRQFADFAETFDGIAALRTYQGQGRTTNAKTFNRTSKAGIIHTQKIGHSVLYQMDGINDFDSVFNPKHKHYKSVTSAELRFIYKHQDTLNNTVRFIGPDGNPAPAPWQQQLTPAQRGVLATYEAKSQTLVRRRANDQSRPGSFAEALAGVQRPDQPVRYN